MGLVAFKKCNNNVSISVKIILFFAFALIFGPVSVAAEEKYSDLSYLEIRNNFERMTKLQIKEYVNSIKGKNIKWTGWVDEVREGWLGGYSVYINMDPPGSLSVANVTFKITREQALSLNKDQRVAFTGEIDSVMSVLGSVQVSLKDPDFIE